MKLTKLTAIAAIALAVSFTGCKPKDADIQSSLQAKEPAGVTVSVNDGIATLTGTVADDAAKTAAEKTAKDEKGVKDVADNLMLPAPAPVAAAPAPVVIDADSTLSGNVKDAVKDHPTVNASVAGGVITLTGSIKKADLPKLMMNLQSLHPKKVESSTLTVN